MRLRNNPKALEQLNESGFLIKQFPILLNDNVVLEIGMGKGEMLTQLAANNPNMHFIGIEKYLTVANIAAKNAKELKLQNFEIICRDIIEIPTLFVGKVNIIWLTFSDPWPKKRHAKRRLTHPNFIDLYKTILHPGGKIKFKTDNDALFDWTLEQANKMNWQIVNITRDLHNSKMMKDNIKTGYEEKWSTLGKNINYLEIIF